MILMMSISKFLAPALYLFMLFHLLSLNAFLFLSHVTLDANSGLNFESFGIYELHTHVYNVFLSMHVWSILLPKCQLNTMKYDMVLKLFLSI